MITELKVESFFRASTSMTNLEGDEITYRGKKKYRINAVIGLAASETTDVLDSAVNNIYVPTEFYDGQELKTAQVKITPYTKPSPIYLNGDRTQGVFYENISLTLEER